MQTQARNSTQPMAGAFANLRKAVVSFVCPYEATQLPMGRFPRNFVFFENLPRKLVSLKHDKNNPLFT
jgi:hypothetical protein